MANHDDNDDTDTANDYKKNYSKFIYAAAAGGASISLFGLYKKYYPDLKQNSLLLLPFMRTCQLEQRQQSSDHLERPDLPTFTLEDVKKHGKDSDRIWVMYKRVIIFYFCRNIKNF